MGKKSKKNKKGKAAAPAAVFGCVGGRPPIEPGRKAYVRGLVSRSDLNDKECTVTELLDSGRAAVEVVHFRNSDLERREVVAVKPENLEVLWSDLREGAEAGEPGGVDKYGNPLEECPICLDTVMENDTSAGRGNSLHMECVSK